MNTHEEIQDMINLYQQGKSLAFIANKYGTYGAKVKKILQENEIAIRTRAEQNKITNQERGKKVNHNYFDDIDTFQKAWLLGFLAADGTVHKDRNLIKIGLSSIDKEVLIKIKEEIESEREVLDYETNQGFSISELAWSSENQKVKLAQYGIVNNKTYKTMHLPDFSNNLKFAYILGFFDGDGCFKNDGSTCRYELCSYRPELLQDIADFINEQFNVNKEVYQDKSRENYYTLTYSTQIAVLILEKSYNIMIENKGFCLQRKLDKYLNWKTQNNRI